jgi:hypothetical protein
MNARSTLPLAVIAVAAVAVLATWNSSCGGGSPTSTPLTTLAPSPAPTTTTTPGASCNLGQGVVYPDECTRLSPQLFKDVEGAMDLLIKERPGIFDLTREHTPGSRAYLVLDREAYRKGLVANLQAAGLCAEVDLDDPYQQTIRAKDSNEFSEDYDVLLSNGFMRRGGGAYRQTCTPPNFPAPRPPGAPPVSSGCGRPFPPPIFKIACRDYLNAGDHHIIDSTPQVADSNYCRSIGYTDGRGLCAVRMEGAPDRDACEDWIVGIAKDTGQYGPTWTRVSDGSFCTDKASGCVHSPTSKYQLWVYEHGYYQVSSTKGGKTCRAYVDR